MCRKLTYIIVFFFLFSGCDAKKKQPVVKETDPVKELTAAKCPPDPIFGGIRMQTAEVAFPDAPNAPSVTVELAATDKERSRGLMYRTHMAKNAGMLFLPDGPPRVQTFWMKNTCIALDMLFITQDGVIAGILENVPPMNTKPRFVPAPSSYVLEVNAGWAAAAGVRSGQRITLPEAAVEKNFM
jgi:uncharacterized protein